MLITNEQIDVTLEMMQAENMTRGSQLGVPVDPHDKNKGLVWKDLMNLEDSDLSKIEEYFIVRENAS